MMTLGPRSTFERVAVGITVLLSLSTVSCGSGSTSTRSTASSADSAAVTTAVPHVSDTTATSAPKSASGSSIATSSNSTTPGSTLSGVANSTPGASETSPSTTADPRPVNAQDEAVALAAVLHPEDFPAPWVVYAPGKSFSPSSDSCTYRPDGAVTLVSNGGAQVGPLMQLGDTGAFVHSVGVAFPDESLAREYIGVVNTDVWGLCFTGQLQKVQTDAGGTDVVKLVTRAEPTLNQNGFESYAEFDITAPDGTVHRVVLSRFYRIGRTVIATVVEYASLSDADSTKFNDDEYNALVAAYARVNAL